MGSGLVFGFRHLVSAGVHAGPALSSVNRFIPCADAVQAVEGNIDCAFDGKHDSSTAESKTWCVHRNSKRTRASLGCGADAIRGGDGDDRITGNGGDDSIVGGLGDDSIDGGDGTDTAAGGEGGEGGMADAGDDIDAEMIDETFSFPDGLFDI
jgi:Ca2+-binding RTX toxin-like protein